MDEIEPRHESGVILEQIYSERKPFIGNGLGFFELKPDDPREPDLCKVTNAESIPEYKWSRIESILAQDAEERIQEIESLEEPQEQYLFKTKDSDEILLSNFTQREIEPEELEEIASWMGTMEAVTKDGLKGIKNIFITPVPAERLETGEAEKGRYLPYYQGIALTLAAFEQVPHRATTKVLTLTCALTHEYFHQFMKHAGVSPLTKEWMRLGGWRVAPSYPEPIGGRYEFSDWENLVETDYGLVSSCDEFCDAAVKAIYDKDSFKNE